MAKQRKAQTSRKPPVPADSHVVIQDWMRRKMPGMNPIVQHLDQVIRETVPDLQYAVKWEKAYYGSADLGWIIEVVAYNVSVNIVFLSGAEFDSPPPLGEGRSRYFKVTSLEEAQDSQIAGWIEHAGSVPGWT